MQPKLLIYVIAALGLAGLGSWFWTSHSSFDVPTDLSVASPAPAADPAPPSVEVDFSASNETPFGTGPASDPDSVDPGMPATLSGAERLERLGGLLSDGRYAEAVEFYGDLYGRLSEEESQRYRRALLAFAESLSANNRHQAVADLMGRYTFLFFKDLQALRLLADSRHALKNYPGEVEAIQLALNEAYLEQDVAEFNRRLEGAIAAQDLLFIQQKDPFGAVEFRRSLALSRPDSFQYALGLARALVNAGEAEEAVTILEGLPENAEFEGQIDRLKQMAEASAPAQASAVPLSRAGNSFVVEVTLNGGQRVKLLVDTGASLTIIRPAALSRAGVGQADYLSQTTLNTAGGNIGASIYRVDSLQLGPEVVTDVRIGSVEIPGLGDIDGLLGMNVLNRFKFAIDQNRQVMLLNR